MADNMFDIKIGIQLDQNGKELTDQWVKIKKDIENDKINIKFDFGNGIAESMKQITQMSGELNKLSSTVQNLNNSGKNTQIIDVKNTISQLNELEKTALSLKDVKKQLSEFGQVSIQSTQVDKITGSILKFIATVKQADGELIKLQYAMKDKVDFSKENKIDNNDGITALTYNFEKIKSITDGTDKIINKVSEFKSKYLEIINSISNENLLPQESIGKVISSLNSLNESSNKLNFDNVKNQVYSLKNELSTVQQQIKNTQEVFNFSNNMSGKIDNLYSNSKGVDLNRLGQLSSQNNNLVDYNSVDELQNVKKLYEEILQQQKEYISQENQKEKAEEQLYNYLFTQEERLKNIRGSYNSKLDVGNNGYQKLESEYNSIIKELENYRIKGQQLTSEESNNIKTRINDLNREKSSIIEVTKTIEQQEQALQSLRNKFGSLVDLSEINKIQTSIQGLGTSTNFKGDNGSITNEINQLRQVAIERQRLSSMGKVVDTNLNVNSSTKDIEQFLKSTISYKSQITSINESFDQMGNKIKTINYNIANGNQINKFKLNLDEASGSVRNMSDGMQDLSSKHATFTDRLKNSISGIINFTIAGTALFSTLNQLRSGYEFINDLNKTQTNIQMISGMPQNEIKGLTQEYSNLAGQMHSTVQEVMTSAESYLRAGKTIEESQAMIKNSIAMSKISAQSQQEVSDEMIAAMNAFGFTADQMGTQYVDKISALDSASATSSKDISEAVMHTAQSAKLAGVSWDYLLSSVTSVMDVTKKSGSEVGNAFRTIFSRMEAISKGKKDDDGTDINQVEKSLGKVGISLRKNEKEWRSMEDVLKDVQSRWSTFDSVTKSDIASKIGGTYQKETILTLMESQQKVQDLMKVTENSIGSADKKMDVYGKSTDARLNDLKHSWETLYMSMYNSDTINSVIGGIGNIINVLTQLTSTSKATTIELIALGTTFVLMIKNWQGAIATIETVMTFFKLLPVAMAESGGVVALLSTSFKGLIGVLNTLLMTPAGLIFTGLATAVGVATYAIVNHAQHMADLKQQTDTLKTSYQNLTQSMKENNVESMKNEVKTQEQQQKKLNDLLKQKSELESKTKNPSTTYDPRIDSAIKNADVDKLKEVTKAIEEQKKVMSEAGISVTTLANAKNQISANENVEAIKKEAEAQTNHNNSIISSIQEYQKLSSAENQNATTKLRLSQLSNELSGNIEGLVTVKDADGNVTIQNTDLLGKSVDMLNTENGTVQTNAKVKMESAKQNAQWQENETTITYKDVLTRIALYQQELEALQKLEASKTGMGTDANGNPVFQRTESELRGAKSGLQNQIDSMSDIKTQIDNIYNQATGSISGTTNELKDGYTPASDDATKSTKKNKEAQDQLSDAIKAVKNEMQSYENQIKAVDSALYALDKSMEGMDTTSDDYINSLKLQNEMFKQRISLVDGATQANNSYIGSIGSMGGVGGSALGSQIVQEAEKYIGTKYVSGGESPSEGFDCSGLIQYVYKQFQIQLDRTTYTQINDGKDIPKNQVEPGDLVFFGNPQSPHHVGIYAGNDQFVESPKPGSNVRLATLSSRSDYSAARRVISDSDSSLANISSNTSSGGYNGKYADIINEASSKYSVPSALIAAVIKTESNWNPNAVSGAGAKGLMQKMQGTNLFDPYSNIMQGTEELSQDLKTFNGDYKKALAAYNAGIGAVQKYGGIPPYKETQEYVPKVLSNMKQYGGTDTVDLANSANGQIQDILSKNEDFAKQNIDFARKIIENNTKIFDAMIGRFDQTIEHVNKNGDLAKAKYDLYKNDGADKDQADQYRDQIYKEINNRFSVLSQKENYIKQEMQNSFYDKATLANMQKALEDVQLEEIKTINELHQEFGNLIQNRYTDATKSNKDDIDELQQKLDEVDTRDKNNFQDKLELNKQMLSQQEEIKAKTIEQIAYVESLLAKEKESTTKQIWIEQIKQLNKDLSDTNKTITTIESTVDELDLSSKLKEYDDNIKKITDTLNVLNEVSSKSYDAKIDLTEKMIEADQKENGVLQERISLLEAERSRYAEGSDGYNESNDKLNDANSKYYENLAKESQHNKDLIKDAENKLMDEIENQIYGGDTQKQFETTYKAQITALDDELKAMSKQNDQLQEQETRQKNLLSLAEAQIKLQDAQNEKNVQQLTKDKNGNWQFQYVANQQTVDDLEKTMRDQVKSNTDWEKQTADKHKQESINDEKERLQAEIDIRSEALNTIKTNIEDALNDENNLFKTGSITVNGIVSSSLDDLKKLYSGNLGDIVDNVRYSVDTITSQFDSINTAFVNAQKNLGSISNQILNPQQQIPTSSKKYVFGSGADLENAQKTLGNKYKYIDIGSMSEEQKKSLKLQEGDILVGGEAVTSGVGVGSGQRIAGQDRTDTANQLQQYAIESGESLRKTIYASGKDLENAKATLGNQYYDFVDITKATQKELQNIKGSDLVIGGSAVTGAINNDASFVGSQRIWGQDADATAKELEKWKNENVNIEKKYGQTVTQIQQTTANTNTDTIKTSTNEQTIIIKSATDNQTMTIRNGSNTNVNTIRSSLNDINDITYDEMGNMVITVQDKMEKINDAMKKIKAPVISVTPSVSGGGGGGTSSGSKTITDTYSDVAGTHHVWSDGSITTEPKNKYANGTTSALGGLSLVGEEGAELRILNQGDGIIPTDITKNLLKLGTDPLGYLKNLVIPNLSNLIANIQLPNIKIPDISSIRSNNSGSSDIKIDTLRIECPNVKDGSGLTEIIEGLKNLPNLARQFSLKNT